MSAIEQAQLSDAGDSVKAEVDALLEEAADQMRAIQDCDAELHADLYGEAQRRVVTERLRRCARLAGIARQLMRAKCELIGPDDPRYLTAQRVRMWTVDGDLAALLDPEEPAA